MRFRLSILFAALALTPGLHAMERAFGWCQQGNQTVQTGSQTSSTTVQRSYPSCTVTVNVHGGGLATIYSDNGVTPLANPFTADSIGFWFFYAANGGYDVVLSGGDISGAVTLSDVLVEDTLIPGAIYNGSSTSLYNAYNYKVTLPTVNTSLYNSYANFWFDYNGFPANSLLGAAANGVLNDTEVVRISQNVTQAGHSQGLTIYQAQGSNQGVPLYVQASAFTDSSSAVLYGADFHIAGCEGIKCNGTSYPDHSPGLIFGVESDVEVRNAATTGIGVYSVCVNCNPFTPNSSAFVSDANKSVGIGDSAYKPWGTSYLSKNGAAIHGSIFYPTSVSAQSDSQDSQWCAYIDGSQTTGCSSIYTSQNNLTFIQSPSQKIYMTDTTGQHLSTLHSQIMGHTYPTTPNALGNTDMGELAINTGATGTVNNSLPPNAAAGLSIRICVTAAQLFNWSAGSNTINVGAISGTTLSSASVGSCATVMGTSSTTWFVTDMVGVWLLDSVVVADTFNKVITGTAGGATVAGGAAATYYAPSGSSTPSTEGTRSIVMPVAGTITGISMYMGTASVGTSGSTVVTLRKNASNTAMTFTLTFNQAAGYYTDNAHSASFTIGDRLSFQLDNSTNNGATGGIVGFAITYR